MTRRILPVALIITTLATLAACADTTTAPKQDCVYSHGVLTCTP